MIHPGRIGKDDEVKYQTSGHFTTLGIQGVRGINGTRPILPYRERIQEFIADRKRNEIRDKG